MGPDRSMGCMIGRIVERSRSVSRARRVLFAADGETSQGQAGAIVAFERVRGVRRVRAQQIGRQQRRDHHHDDARARWCRRQGLTEQYAQPEGGGGRSPERFTE